MRLSEQAPRQAARYRHQRRAQAADLAALEASAPGHGGRDESSARPTSRPRWTAAPRRCSSTGSCRSAPTTASRRRGESDHVGETGVRWILDPIDGVELPSTASPRGRCRSQPGDRRRHRRRRGRRPRARRTYVATLGKGPAARRAGRAHAASTTRSRLPAALATGFGYTRERHRAQARVVAGVIPRCATYAVSGACSVDLCHVATGRVDAYYERGPQAWDSPPAKLSSRRRPRARRGPARRRRGRRRPHRGRRSAPVPSAARPARLLQRRPGLIRRTMPVRSAQRQLTGCSTGIGRAAHLTLDAASRSTQTRAGPETLADMAARGIHAWPSTSPTGRRWSPRSIPYEGRPRPSS